MGRLHGIAHWLDERLPALLREHDVPAMSVAVLAGDERIESASGVLNTNTGVEATTDSVFQVGSITKPWTATLVMQLVDDGLLDLDVPVREYLPAFRLANVDASLAVTARHLLSHTSGVEGDIYTDVGRGDDAIERVANEILPDVPQLFPPGALYSYSNLGFVVLGRIVEFLRGKPYREVLLERLAKPLGLRTVSPLADDAILHRVAVGHVRAADGGWRPAAVWAQGHGGLPSGSMLAMSAGDLLTFAQAHLHDGAPLLSHDSARAMRTPTVELPPLTDIDTAYGLGWTLETWHGGQVITHRGGTIGQAARLHLVPEHGVAAVAMANRAHPGELLGAVLGHVIHTLTGLEAPPAPKPPAQPERVDPARYVGRYEDYATRIDIEADANGDLWRVFQAKGELDKLIGHTEPERDRIVRLRDDTFIAVYDEEAASSETYVFVGTDEHGRAAYLHIGTACPRVS